LVGFVDLYPVTADGHFVYAYDYGALTLVAQYPDGRFHRRWALSPLTEAFAATSDGWLHGVFVGDGSAVRYQRGSPWIPFITKDLGPAPFAMGGNFGQAPPGFDSSGVLYFTSGLADGNLWLGAYDGKGLSFQRWFDRPFAYLEIDPFFGFGVDAADRPYLVLDRNVYQGTETVCLVFREGVSNRVEVVATGSFAMLLDWEASPDGRMAAVYDHYVVGTSASIESYVRTENLY
jgi:hypothetical protein